MKHKVSKEYECSKSFKETYKYIAWINESNNNKRRRVRESGELNIIIKMKKGSKVVCNSS